ncbi:hypothetical protein [Agromyces sp. Leaf222]|uniref:hypothetical protein n=1 Tax=Agromyces sp. Leaf222 TaxID=1735688 RepID=UPI000A9AB0C0|nr:hypothetical protein [Agromyces sp. Leaf222]
MKWRDIIFLACALVLSVTVLAVAHYSGDPAWLLENLPAARGGDGILWQVQTTFLSVGFAGLAIAAQLFAEAPLAIGASRGRVLEYVGASRFVGVGLVANAVIAIETIWLQSMLGVIFISAFWFIPTVVMLVVSTVRLTQLFGHPSQLDEVVRQALVETLSNRLDEASRKHAGATHELNDLVVSGWTMGIPKASTSTLRVPVPEVGRVIKAIKAKIVRQAIDSVTLRATEESSTVSSTAEQYTPPQIALDVDPGDRTRLGETAFRVITSNRLDEATNGRVVRLLQSSIEFEPPTAVTPYEETNREIANLKDAIGVNLRSGALASAERALELLGHIVQGVWVAGPEHKAPSRRTSFTRRDWLFRSIGEVEQDALLSPRVADLFVSAAMTRALEAPRTGSAEYVDECLRSFTRLWFDVLRNGGREFDAVPPRITTCVQNLAAYSYKASEEREDLQARGAWAMVELVKLALDAKKPDAAQMAALELSGLFEFDRQGSSRSHVRAGQLVLSGWLDYLADKGDARSPADPSLRETVSPRGTLAEILAARRMAERGIAPFSRWDWWESETTASNRAQTLQLSRYIDRAQLSALASSRGRLPQAEDQETASTYNRFLNLLADEGRVLSADEERLKQRLTEVVAEWDAAEDERLALEPLSEARVETLRTALRATLNERQRLAALIPSEEETPDTADLSRPILGMNFRVPRHYLVDEVFSQTYADPKELGQMIARGFVEGEEQKIVSELRELPADILEPTASAIRKAIDELGDEAKHFVLITPYGGVEDSRDWYSIEFNEALKRVIHIETVVLEAEAFLFDRRSTFTSCREPEQKVGLSPVEGTSIALGVFEDVQDSDEPQVRVETGEYFALGRGSAPRILHFGAVEPAPRNLDAGDMPPEGEAR